MATEKTSTGSSGDNKGKPWSLHPTARGLRDWDGDPVPPTFPRRFWGLGLADVEPTKDSKEAYEAVVEWAQGLASQQERDGRRVCANRAGYGRGLCLSGPYGTLKTTIAAAALYDIHRQQGATVGFVRFPDLLEARRPPQQNKQKDRFRSSHYVDHDANELEHLEEAVRRADVLLLDDVGSERVVKDSGFAAEILESTLRKRFDAGRPTLITTNLLESDWETRYDERIASFLHEVCREYLVLGGPDLRMQS
ncbi:hypothetical protein EF910_31940 [Streptomyces sp. WAC07149]|uniref:ATP-binding protein n=1 Tax=Streptomyces sp. WAC07149 TaxID=2487425 RepID=UPI000F780184|nr:ATP-binding protein [Streptomyces sp. WAC07149]RST00349.1 hypothetical protein EF910_31940 [Streptomyces sp. WAC07149]